MAARRRSIPANERFVPDTAALFEEVLRKPAILLECAGSTAIWIGVRSTRGHSPARDGDTLHQSG